MFRASRRREQILAALAPFVADTRSRLGDISEDAWSEPRTLGFLMSLVTLLAAGGKPLGSTTLGSVQAQVWSRLTGCSADGIGERLALLAATGDAAFHDGCRRAIDFVRQLDPETVNAHVPAQATELADLLDDEIEILGRLLFLKLRADDLRALELWSDVFEPLALGESPLP